MNTAIHRTIEEPWVRMEPLRLGSVPSGLGTPERFVTVASETGPLLRIDLFASNDEAYEFEQLVLWSHFVAIGWGCSLFIVEPLTRQAERVALGAYFAHAYLFGDDLLVATAERLFRFGPDGSLIWKSDVLGVDGVVVDSVSDGIVEGSGELDPAGGWRRFRLSLRTGAMILGAVP